MSRRRPRADPEAILPGIAPGPPRLQKARDAFASALLLSQRSRKGSNYKPSFELHFRVYKARSSPFFADLVLAALLQITTPAALRLLRGARSAFSGRRQGRPRRRILSHMQCIIIAAAHDGAGMSRTDILDILQRPRIEESDQWLSRRIAYGRELTTELPWSDLVERTRRDPRQIRGLLRSVAEL
jgi:hypothetical protein